MHFSMRKSWLRRPFGFNKAKDRPIEQPEAEKAGLERKLLIAEKLIELKKSTGTAGRGAAGSLAMSALMASRDPLIPLQHAGAALGMSRATLQPKAARPPVTRRVSEAERQAVLDVLHEPRFADQPPAQMYAKRPDEGRYLCSVRTMHRLLAERGGSGERQIRRAKTRHPVWP